MKRYLFFTFLFISFFLSDVAIASNDNLGTLNINVISSEELPINIELNLLKLDTNEETYVRVLASENHKKKIKLPYGQYKIVFLEPAVEDVELYKIKYDEDVVIGSNNFDLNIDLEELKEDVSQKGWIRFKGKVPFDLEDDLGVLIGSRFQSIEVTLSAENNYTYMLEVPFGDYSVLNSAIENDIYGKYTHYFTDPISVNKEGKDNHVKLNIIVEKTIRPPSNIKKDSISKFTDEVILNNEINDIEVLDSEHKVNQIDEELETNISTEKNVVREESFNFKKAFIVFFFILIAIILFVLVYLSTR